MPAFTGHTSHQVSIQLIEDHAEEITRTLLQKVRHDPLLPRYRELSDFELLDRFRKACNKLGYWLADSDPEQVATAHEGLGRDRFNEQIPLHEVVHAAHLIKNQLTGYARRVTAGRNGPDVLLPLQFVGHDAATQGSTGVEAVENVAGTRVAL